MTIKMFEVGGCVRDELLGIKSKDIDFSVEAESFDAMREWMKDAGFKIFVETEHFFTIRAHFPREGWDQYKGLTADFVLCRKEGPYTDGRRPDWVEMGTIYDDLARRDFTVNAMAKDLETNDIIDPHNGRDDLSKKLLRCVGDTQERFTEDALRALRAIRFSVTKNFWMTTDIKNALHSAWLPPLLEQIAKERQYDEVMKMFKADTQGSILAMGTYNIVRKIVFANGLWLKPSLEQK